MAAPDPNDPSNSSVNPASSGAPPRPSWETPRPPSGFLPSRPLPQTQPAAPAPIRSASPPPAAFVPPASAPPSAYPQPPDTDIQYDLAGNPIPGSGRSAASAAPGSGAFPMGQAASPSAQPAGSWPPAPTSSVGYGVGENGTDRVARLKWNWGAFFIPFWWSIFNGQKGIALAIFLINGLNRVVPAPYDWGLIIGSLGIQIYLGAMGNRLAWASDRFGGDYDHFIRTQRAWMIWGFIVAAVITVGIFAAGALLPGFWSALATGQHPQPASYSSPNGSGQ